MSNHFVLSVEATDENRTTPTPQRVWTLLLLVFVAVYFAALFSPALLDDADSTHANAARHIVESHDWVTLKVDGIRYLEKPPLVFWAAAIDYHLFGFNTFATHLPLALSVLGLAALAWFWGRRAYGDRAALYAALAVFTSIGVFLFTRILIPDVMIAFLLAVALYAFLTGLEDGKPGRIYIAWAALAMTMLAKGLMGPAFFAGTVAPYLFFTGDWRRWREFRIFSGILLFLAIAAPWHILAGLHNPDQGHPVGNIPTPGNVHGFFYFYFINEQVLRFLGKRYPDDYNKLPPALYWSLHLVWLFPWSLYLPVVLRRLWKDRTQWWKDLRSSGFSARRSAEGFRRKTILLLALFAAVVLIFFSISTNQEYYTFPAYFPLLLLTAGVLADAEDEPGAVSRWLNNIQAAFAVLGFAAAGALAYGLWLARKMPYVADIGSLLDYRDVANYTLSMAHLFDLTGKSFAALRLPAVLAAVALIAGPSLAWRLRVQRRHFEATVSVAFTVAIFLIAAHIALVRFEPMLSSKAMAETFNRVAASSDRDASNGGETTLLLYGDEAFGSSMIFYTGRQALLVNGRVNSMLWGSYYPDAPHIFLDDPDLLAIWGTGSRKVLFVPEDSRQHVERLLGKRGYLIQVLSGKALYTDRPLRDPGRGTGAIPFSSFL